MRHYGTLLDSSMKLKSGMVIRAFDYSTGSPYYDVSQVGPITASETTQTGRYYFEITNTGKYTIVITKTDSTLSVLASNIWLEGDDEIQNPAT